MTTAEYAVRVTRRGPYWVAEIDGIDVQFSMAQVNVVHTQPNGVVWAVFRSVYGVPQDVADGLTVAQARRMGIVSSIRVGKVAMRGRRMFLGEDGSITPAAAQ